MFLASEPIRFVGAAFEDCGDGWDWRIVDPTLRFWVEGVSFEFEVFEHGFWSPVAAMDLYLESGRVAFGRCLRDLDVRGSGFARPLTALGCGSHWDTFIEAAPTLPPVFDAAQVQRRGQILEASAILYDCTIPDMYKGVIGEEPALAVLPLGSGALVGLGSVDDKPGRQIISFNEKGVSYVLV